MSVSKTARRHDVPPCTFYFIASFMFVLAACGGTGNTDNPSSSSSGSSASSNDGGGSSSSDSGSGGGDGGSDTGGGQASSSTGTAGGSSGTGGGGAMCHPTFENEYCSQGKTPCECVPTATSNKNWCDFYKGMGMDDICPASAISCQPNAVRCSYDLPLEVTDYVPPTDPSSESPGADPCWKALTNGGQDSWKVVRVIDDTESYGTFGGGLNENGEFGIGGPLDVGPNENNPDLTPKFTGLTIVKVDGKLHGYWNGANAPAMDWAYADITKCETGYPEIHFQVVRAGETQPDPTQEAVATRIGN